ncbi:putative RNA 2',3'-cyclic phosphodiesterase [Methylacidimicrobium sp. AP8]|uniref:RNA 2',3'-cyclic phosphodiesterase n=1 Tax=Methylacidimicrobium sp. AP8 TaxID=2730359 RepID=UPI0018C04732|nr:RNA 2',3'-cyclic phosphodiesterase [Methylacidimicrobium sp. AP8]CAB4244583.1 putative RNA 2',3'-cyclic phosphodiesterase [Methylacidimicrobium sp. AP8]
MRLFFALWPSPREQVRFREAAQGFERTVSCRWTAQENLHLTLLFLPSVDEERIDSLISLVTPCALPRICLHLDRLLLQPAGREGLLWLAPSERSAALEHLVESLRKGLPAAGVPRREGPPFFPHITLARRVILPTSRRSGGRQPVLLHRLACPIDWSVREMALVRSETLPEGSRYRRLASWTLPAPA